jgi:hypothetical protein
MLNELVVVVVIVVVVVAAQEKFSAFFFDPFSSSISGWPDSQLESLDLLRGTPENPFGPLGSLGFFQRVQKNRFCV